MVSYVAVHGGAGSHDPSLDSSVKRSLKQSCREAIQATERQSSTPLTAIEVAISVLEDQPSFNAGHGSNLTYDGMVECDAALMDSSSNFGGVGAVAGIKNPIRLARQVLEYSTQPDLLGRIAPLTLVSSGARSFASHHAEDLLVPPESLVSVQSEASWRHWMDQLQNSTDNTLILAPVPGNRMQDTVGAVVWYPSNSSSIAAGVSSGGLLLKLPGRVGEAALFGCGCWAHQVSSRTNPSIRRHVGCSVSGAGEQIIRASLARRLGEAACGLHIHREPSNTDFLDFEELDSHEILQEVLTEEFWRPARARGDPHPNAGVLMLTVDENGSESKARLWCAFTTPSMSIAYMSSGDKHPKALILRRPDRAQSNPDRSEGSPVYVEGISLT